ncbi:MAG TPA: hypothetical protein VK675_03120 [Candidatus Paceibacterota bacterium]|nr:hypothetical protein [Candidatus Paceibacterota bacterium]
MKSQIQIVSDNHYAWNAFVWMGQFVHSFSNEVSVVTEIGGMEDWQKGVSKIMFIRTDALTKLITQGCRAIPESEVSVVIDYAGGWEPTISGRLIKGFTQPEKESFMECVRFLGELHDFLRNSEIRDQLGIGTGKWTEEAMKQSSSHPSIREKFVEVWWQGVEEVLNSMQVT